VVRVPGYRSRRHRHLWADCLENVGSSSNNPIYLVLYIDIPYFYHIFLSYVCLDAPDHGTCLYTADSTDPLVTFIYIYCVYFTWRWPPIGAETCCKLVHNKIEHRNIVAYGGFKKNISLIGLHGLLQGWLYSTLTIHVPYDWQNKPKRERCVWVQLSLSYGRRSVDQFVLVSGSPLGPMARFYPYPFFSDNCFVVLPVGRPLWREDGSVAYSAIVDWSGHGGPTTIHYCLIWDCVPSSSPLTTRRDHALMCLNLRHGLERWLPTYLTAILWFNETLVIQYIKRVPSWTTGNPSVPPAISWKKLNNRLLSWQS
jgi:hypothetical protein